MPSPSKNPFYCILQEARHMNGKLVPKPCEVSPSLLQAGPSFTLLCRVRRHACGAGSSSFTRTPQTDPFAGKLAKLVQA